jgi:hypothetical protein
MEHTSSTEVVVTSRTQLRLRERSKQPENTNFEVVSSVNYEYDVLVVVVVDTVLLRVPYFRIVHPSVCLYHRTHVENRGHPFSPDTVVEKIRKKTDSFLTVHPHHYNTHPSLLLALPPTTTTETESLASYRFAILLLKKVYSPIFSLLESIVPQPRSLATT